MGEVRYLWQALSRDRTRCGCGERVRDCSHWKRVLARAYEDLAMVPLTEIKAEKSLEDMILTRRGNRLSIMPVEKKHWKKILSLE